MGRRIAVLSNVNMNFVIRMLKDVKVESGSAGGEEVVVYEAEGYGNELGLMLDRGSSYHAFGADITFLVMDLMEVLEHDLGEDGARVERWFSMLEGCLLPDKLYYVSDAYLWGPEMEVVYDPGRKMRLESLWQKRLEELCANHPNVRLLPYRRMIEGLGEENAFSLKMWYMGGILHTAEAQKRLCGLIAEKIRLEIRTPKKVLLLDLDNTLWGGLAGENDVNPIALSQDHTGLAYKNLQRVILMMQEQGVLLGIVSKNNEDDAMEILEHHPHMVLRPERFAARRINWEPKHENILEIAKELNLGIDSFVFWDDSPAERALVSRMLPQVAVPDFPGKPEELAGAMARIYHEYFEKTSVTEEDLTKTAQYAANARRESLQEAAVDFDSYLKQLNIVITRQAPHANAQRLVQLVNKTNQFNVTTVRYDQAQMLAILNSPEKRVYLYSVKDCFGDNGIVAAAIVNLPNHGEAPFLEELVMSCRVMGRNIEYAVVEDIENDLQASGFTSLKARYVPTAKNKPVEMLFEKLGYTVLEEESGRKEYEIVFSNRPKRVYYAEYEYNPERRG